MAGKIALDTEIRFVKGVGPARAKSFAKLGVHTVGDLVEFFPFRHQLRPASQPLGSLVLGQVATVMGELRGVRVRGQAIVTASIVDGTGRCRVRWFNSSYLLDRLHDGSVVRLSGKFDLYRDQACFTNPQTTIVDEKEPQVPDEDAHEPVYPATAELPSRQIRKIVDALLDDALPSVVEFLPDALRRRRGLPPRRTAVQRCHRPTSPKDVPVARRRIAYDEFLLFQLAVQMSRQASPTSPNARPILVDERTDARIRRRFPFPLTEGQNRAIREITADLAQPKPMNRLLQADVGAGKTAVALYAALAAIVNRRQVAFLAPTEVLAAQHHAKITQYLSGSRVRIAYLAGSSSRGGRTSLLKQLGEGAIDLIVGTHALLEGDVAFHDLGLAVIDEQHKFGVSQRAALRRKATAPHVLVLTATPIPRTLAMTIFGDLDVTTIAGLPPGRKPVVTRLVTEDHIEQAWTFVRRRLSAREQAYVVYPLVEESDSLPLRAASAEVQRLGHGPLAGFRLGLLHGRLKAADKAEVMRAFHRRELDVLVATTVIEVGVDVANATMMIVQHADRFGLSQLHQLRGRVGRGSAASYCLLFADPKGESATTRLSALCATSDGFKIAEEDLRLRGPGELLGTRQHGLPAFRVANLIDDFDLLQMARDDAAAILREDAGLNLPRHAPLREAVARKYAKTIPLVEVA